MLYLAQIQRSTLTKPKLLLIARKRPDGIWMATDPPPILLDLPAKYDRPNYSEGVLVLLDLVEVEGRQQVSSIRLATSEIVRSLSEYSSKSSTFDNQVKEWKESLQEQAEEFLLRQQRYERWVKLLKQNFALAQAWESLLEQERKYLKDAGHS